ncbi:MAG: LamG-like jellyroll fold domain-containing protein, partial [Calditrichia bacterium]
VQGQSVELYCTAMDLDSDPLLYAWTASGGNMAAGGAAAFWNAADTGSYNISCIVSDQHGGTDSAGLQLRVVESINHAPVITDLQALPRKIDLGAQSQLICTAADPDGDSLQYIWSASDGVLSGSDSSVIWTAPLTAGNYFVHCRVSDGRGGEAQDSISIVVRDFSQFQPGDIMAHYPLDGNANDISGNGHDGIVHGAQPAPDRFSNPGSAYYFDGINDYISVPNHDSLNFRPAISVSFWMNIGELFTHESFPISHGSWENRWKASLIPGGKLRWTIKTDASQNNGIVDLDSEEPLNTGEWYHVVLFYDGADFELYLNGVLNNFTQWSGLIRTTTFDLTIGQMLPTNSSYNFKGILDDIIIFDYGLSVSEIEALYQMPNSIEPDQTAEEIPTEFQLFQNYPNPFNPITTISFALPAAAHVRLEIFDISGRKIVSLADEIRLPGSYDIVWHAENMASGIYFYRLQAIGKNNAAIFSGIRKLILLR